jgi:hypothetical protein
MKSNGQAEGRAEDAANLRGNLMLFGVLHVL